MIGLIALVLAVCVGAAIVGYRLSRMDSGPEEQIACTMEAKLCPDGSYVGRTGPMCEFAECPGGVPPSSDAGLNETITVSGIEITPLEVLEDSRCPTDVQCIQAGTVRVSVRIVPDTIAFTLGQPQTIDGVSIALTRVSPDPVSTREIADEDYRFAFEAAP